MEPIENLYFNWLCAKVKSAKDRNYDDLLRILYSTEFLWVIRGDENREADGLELREDFMIESEVEYEPDWYDSPCSVLEMLVALAKRASYQTGMSKRDWFQIFLANLQLDEFRRVISNNDREEVDSIISALIFRTYNNRGEGGLFPLRSPERDQRKLELWYQCCDYIAEQQLV